MREAKVGILIWVVLLVGTALVWVAMLALVLWSIEMLGSGPSRAHRTGH